MKDVCVITGGGSGIGLATARLNLKPARCVHTAQARKIKFKLIDEILC